VHIVGNFVKVTAAISGRLSGFCPSNVEQSGCDVAISLMTFCLTLCAMHSSSFVAVKPLFACFRSGAALASLLCGRFLHVSVA